MISECEAGTFDIPCSLPRQLMDHLTGAYKFVELGSVDPWGHYFLAPLYLYVDPGGRLGSVALRSSFYKETDPNCLRLTVRSTTPQTTLL